MLILLPYINVALKHLFNVIYFIVIPQPVYANSQQLFPQASTQENENTFANSGSRITTHENSSSQTADNKMSKCLISSDNNTSIINVQSAGQTMATSNTDILTGKLSKISSSISNCKCTCFYLLCINSYKYT